MQLEACAPKDQLKTDDTPTSTVNELPSHQRSTNDGDGAYVTLSIISQATGVSTKALRQRVASRAPIDSIWRPDANEMKTLINDKAFGPSVVQGLLIHRDYVSTLAPEVDQPQKRKRTETGDDQALGSEAELGAQAGGAGPPNINGEIHHVAKKQSVEFDAIEKLKVNDAPPPYACVMVDMTAHRDMAVGVDTDTSSASTISAPSGTDSTPTSRFNVVAMAAMAGSMGFHSVQVAEVDSEHGHDSDEAPVPVVLTDGQRKRRGFVVIPSGVTEDVQFKLAVVRAVARSSRVARRKRHQFEKVASAMVCQPTKPVKRSGSAASRVTNVDLVESKLFVEALIPSIGFCLRSTVALASEAVWDHTAQELGVARHGVPVSRAVTRPINSV